MSYASASKWLYGAYVIQRTGGRLDATDIKFLSLQSGYTNLKACASAQTVESCLAVEGNGDYSLIADGKFFYNSGHMQKHASLIGLGAYDNTGLATELRKYLGEDLPISYSQPQLAGGAFGTAETYARFLQKILNGQLLIRRMLGDAAVCTNPATCGISTAIYTPIPNAESWSYSLGHWVETDPLKGDNAFSSGGGLGFYPWIDSAVQYYGIVARLAVDGGQPSADCGRLIRKAWLSGVAQ